MTPLSWLIYDAVRETPLTQIDTSMPLLTFSHRTSQGSLNALIVNHIHPQIEELVGKIWLSGGRSGRA